MSTGGGAKAADPIGELARELATLRAITADEDLDLRSRLEALEEQVAILASQAGPGSTEAPPSKRPAPKPAVSGPPPVGETKRPKLEAKRAEAAASRGRSAKPPLPPIRSVSTPGKAVAGKRAIKSDAAKDDAGDAAHPKRAAAQKRAAANRSKAKGTPRRKA